MNTKKANRYLDDTFEWSPPDCEDRAEKCIPEIKELLQRGKKYEAMYKKLKNNFPYLRGELEVKEFIEEFEQKYFLKPLKGRFDI